MTTTYGDPVVAYGNEILRSVVGSGLHGIAIEGTDDHDEMGIFIEPEDHVLGLGQRMDHYIFRTQDEGVRSGPGDVDRTLYSLRKYLGLAIKGNPTALLPLFAPESDLIVTTSLGDELRELRQSFLSREAAERFLGYMHQQRERMMGRGRRSAVPNRPELVEKYGWDTKYGSHELRLAYQGRELITEGKLTLPLSPDVRSLVLDVKTGKYQRDNVDRLIGGIERRCRARLNSNDTPLPAKPDLELISEWSIHAHQTHWNNK